MNKKPTFDFTDRKHVYFIGIGGINMSAIAHVLLARGFSVSGSDSHASALTDELEEMGATIYVGQRADNVKDDVDAIVYTAAISPDNPEMVRAGELGVPPFTRAEFLG